MSSAARSRKQLGLALGGGGARGVAHLGVLRGLRDAGIEIDAIAGTSAGALAGALFAAGQLESFQRELLRYERSDWLRLIDPVWPRSGLISGKRIGDELRRWLGDWQIDDLPIRFAAVAVDLASGEEIWLRTGKLVDAVRASISLPGVFVPARWGARWLVDGAIRNPVPVSALGALACDVRIAVDLNTEIGRGIDEEAPTLFSVLGASFGALEHELARHRLSREPPDVLIEPKLGGVRLQDVHKAPAAIAVGHAALAAALPAIRRALEAREPNFLTRYVSRGSSS